MSKDKSHLDKYDEKQDFQAMDVEGTLKKDLKYKNMHPNTLKNLKPFTREGAIKGQKASVEAKRRNKAAREALKVTAKEWKALGAEFGKEVPPALDVLRIAMTRALTNEDMEEATRLATVLAEFESPKLQRQDITQVTSTADLTDDELKEELKKVGIDKTSFMLDK